LPKSVSLSEDVPAGPGCVKVILEADLIIIGPRSIITSILPAFLVEEIAAAIQKTSACRIFIENSKTEKSVMKNTSTPGVDWLAEQLSFKLYDLNIPPSAIKEILQGSKTILKNRAIYTT
tara:strand:+ start:1214 stop:1573 length:360 start_codon:yes stop_codon:yes gene_type:complete